MEYQPQVKKILFISNYVPAVGGISVQVDLLAECLRKEGHGVAIFSTKGNPLQRIMAFFHLMSYARRFDVLHAHGCSHWGMLPVVYTIIIGKLWHKRVVVTYHGGGAADFFASHARFARRWLCRADAVIVLSGYLEKVFHEHDIPCVVIPNMLGNNVQSESILRTSIRPRFISVRHLEPLYNIPCILRAYEEVVKHLPDASLTILGKGSQRNMLEQYVLDHQLPNVQFLGQVPNDELQHLLADHDIFLSAPRTDNMPVSVLEAMRAGLLVISSRVGGVPYIVEDGRTGCLFESDNDEELAEKMLWAVSRPEECETIIEAAHEDVKKYSWNFVKPELFKVYDI